ncbi:putative ATP-dependent RNA helicase DDX49 [Willisornis vidua]|uniref:ATP-dependent RNA helicase DDX49 n=1 Tax=Willisornis vidua TaxID=1566151 RepID=A0ABQ9E1D6_9PASS|nr:putative ATP-dependent RNA helicase DDX49 [Willisornis vidua]
MAQRVQNAQLWAHPHGDKLVPAAELGHLWVLPAGCALSCARAQVLDEADRLLEQGCADFSADLELILEEVPAKRQTLLFSATLTATLSQLRGLAANRPFFWEAETE